MLASSSIACWPTTDPVDRAGPARCRPVNGVEYREQALGRDLAVRVLDDSGDLVPIGIAVEPDADPAPAADVRRHEEAVRFLINDLRLHTGGSRAPQREPAVAVVIVEIHHERLLHEERR